jgi:putative tributyrin esterase
LTRFRRNSLLLLVLSAIVILAVWVRISRPKPPEPSVDHPRLAPGVIMRDVTFRSQALQRDMQYRIFMPESPGKQKLPVVYLLHGGGGGFRDWSNYSNVARYAAHDLLLVMPQGDYSYYTNSAAHPQDRYEDYIVNDLADDVEARFPARADREGRAIIGVSMGGFGAVKLALQHPERYAFVGALSPAIDVPRRRFTWRRLNQSRSYQEIFGAEGSDTRRNNDPFLLAQAADPKSAPYFYLTCGREEGLLSPNREFDVLLGKRGVAHEFHSLPGGHEWNQWAAQLPAIFASLRLHRSGPMAAAHPLRTHVCRRHSL